MELKCPSCLNALNAAGGSIPRACPACGAAIEVLEHGESLTLLGAKRQEYLDLKNSYVTYGHFFWKNPQNLIFPLIAGFVAAFFMLAGCWLFRYVGRQKKKHETLMSDSNHKG